jgi:AraC-like DNA-binding protein
VSIRSHVCYAKRTFLIDALAGFAGFIERHLQTIFRHTLQLFSQKPIQTQLNNQPKFCAAI